MPKFQEPNLTSINRATQAFREAGGTLRTASVFKAGIHPRTLYAMRDSGEIECMSRGIYRLTDAPSLSNPDLVVVAQAAPRATICLISALAFYQLTTQIPHRVDIAIAQGGRAPSLKHPPLNVYRFGGKSLTEGVETHQTDGTPIRIYSAAKTIADCFKFRNRIGIDIAVEALRTYLKARSRRIDDLLHFATINRVRHIIMPYIEAIL